MSEVKSLERPTSAMATAARMIKAGATAAEIVAEVNAKYPKHVKPFTLEILDVVKEMLVENCFTPAELAA